MSKEKYKRYLQLIKDPTYVELYKYYSRETLMGILGCARSETAHSSFLRWLLDINGSHGLGSAPMRKFLETVCWFYDTVYCDKKNEDCFRKKDLNSSDTIFSTNKESFLEDIRFGRYDITNQYIANEVVISDKRRADILALVELNRQSKNNSKNNDDSNKVFLTVLIENKVESKEQQYDDEKWQTKEYEAGLEDNETQKMIVKRCKEMNNDWIEEDMIKKSEKLFIYLNPCKKDDIKDAINETESICFARSHKFITLNYQYLLDGVIEPLFDTLEDGLLKERLEDYIRCLGLAKISNINEYGISGENDYLIMAVSASEREKALSLWKSHHKIIFEIIKSLEFDKNKQSNFFINESDRPFWTSLSNLYRLIGTDKLYDTINEKRPNNKYNDLLVALLRVNYDPDGRKHLFVFKEKEYVSYDKKNPLGKLGRVIIKDYILHQMESKNAVDNIIKNIRDEIRSRNDWYPNWRDEWLICEDEIDSSNKCKRIVIEIPNCKKIFVAEYWTYDEICGLIHYFNDNKYTDVQIIY